MRLPPSFAKVLANVLANVLARAFAFGLCSMAFSAGALAQTLPAGMSRGASVEGIAEYRLANGLQVLLVPDDAKPTTTVNVTYRVGSRHENYGETGMAHLLEHMIFKGTPTTKDAWAEFSRRGMRPNGTTSFDRTNYFASFAANDDTLRWYLGWQADAMVNSLIARADLDTEMTVVRNEFEAGENNPGRVLWQNLMAAMYRWHNYGKSIIGARTDIENVDIPRLQAFYKLYYQPDNATLIVSGKFDADKVLAWTAQSFGPIPKPTRALPSQYTLDPPQDGERAVTVRRSGGTAQLMVGWHVMPAAHPDYAATALLSLVLGDTPGGRLHKRIVEKQLAASTYSFAMSLTEPGPLFAGASLGPGQDVDKVRTELLGIVDGLVAEPVTAQELERARTTWLNNWDLGFTDPERVGIQLSESISHGDWRLYFLLRDRVRQATLADVQRVATTWLRKDNRNVATYLPTTTPERAPQAARVDIAPMVANYKGDPNAAQAEAFEPTPANLDARTQTSTSASGLKVALLSKGTRGRVVQARLRLRYGSEKSLFGQEMVGTFAASLIDKGGAGMTRQQIADRFDKLQAQVAFTANDQTLEVGITTRRQHLPAAVELVGKLLREPSFPPEALEELRRQYLASIERARKEPGSLVASAVARHGNPYPRGDLRHAQSFDESEQDIKAVTRDQLVGFQRRFYSAGTGEFSAVGDFDATAVNAVLDKTLGDWKQPAGGAEPWVRLPRPLVPVAAARFVELTPDKANANLQGSLSIPVSDRHPDYAALTLASYMFGQSQNSRLWKRIRETEGLSYDVRASLAWSSIEENTAWNFSAIFAPQNQAKVEASFKDELTKTLRDGFGAQELAEAKNGLLNQRRLARAQDGGIAFSLVNNLYLGRTFAFAQASDEGVSKATLEQVNAAWRRHIDPAKLVFAWGGDFKAAP
jgi:zinc protease